MSHKHANDFHMDGKIVRWNTTNNIPFDDLLVEFLNANLINELEFSLSSQKRVVEANDSINKYKKFMTSYVPDEEELFEMRAAFGEGTSVVNAITGRRISL